MFFRFCGALRAVTFQQRAQVLAGKAAGHGGHLFRGALGYDLTACAAALRAKVDDMVGALDEIQIMLDDDDRISHVHQLLQHLDQTVHVCNVQTGGGLVQNIHCFIGPNCGMYTAVHATIAEERNLGLEKALPITIGDNVWMGGDVTILPGITIGGNTIIGAGSVVTKDIPSNVVAAGNPCRVLRPITEADRIAKK